MHNDTRAAALALLMTVTAALAAIVTGDLVVTLVTILAGLVRLARTHLRRPRSVHLYRARFAVQVWL